MVATDEDGEEEQNELLIQNPRYVFGHLSHRFLFIRAASIDWVACTAIILS